MAISEQHIWSDLPVHPGETLLDEIEFRGISQKELARRLGRPPQAINEIVRGKKSITPATALGLESVLDIPAQFWTNMQLVHDMTLARNFDRERLEQQIPLLDEFPINEMKNRGLIPGVKEKTELVDALCRFFGVASLDRYQQSCPAAFRITGDGKYSHEALAVWLRQGEIEAENIDTPSFDKTEFLRAVEEIRGFTSDPPEVFLPAMKDVCARSGVVLMLTPELPKCGANGVARRVSGDRRMIQLNLRWRWSDIFWFTFFHEAAHVLLHKQDVYVDFAKREIRDSALEDEADKFAADVLIEPTQWRRFVEPSVFSEKRIISFASRMGIDPGIVVGRLQHEKRIDYNRFTKIKTRFTWT